MEFNLRKTKEEVLHTLPSVFYASDAKKLLSEIGDSNPDRTVKRWERANLIACTGKDGRIHIYRKLTSKETQQKQKLSLKQLAEVRRCR